MKRFILFCTAVLTAQSVLGDTCTRCRAFDLTLTCAEEENSVERMYNGYMCAAMSGENVALTCTLGDSDGYTLSYSWYKSSSIGGQSFADTDGAEQISNCTTSVCNVYDVSWTSSSEPEDNVFYQCIVAVQENETTVATFYSNALALEVQSYSAATEADSDSHTVDIGTAETKLSCSVPDTNPSSSVIWYYSSNSSTNGSELETMDNMLIVQETIVSTDAKYGYSNGMLVIMNFEASNAGTYQCAVSYTNKFGTTTQKYASTHVLASSGITLSSVSEGLRVVSQVQSPDFLFKDTEETVLNCLGSNLVAGDTANHYWQQAEEVEGVEMYKNISSGSGFAFSNNNRTLTLDKDYDLQGAAFRCQIQKGVDSILVNGYSQAPIIPKSGYVPTGLSCATNSSTYTATIDELMTADISSSGVIQVLAGSSYYWKKDDADINKFSSGYTVSSSSLAFSVATDTQCHYMQQFKYYDSLYSIQQIFALSVLDEDFTTVPTVALESSGGDTVTITCTAAVSSYPTALENKVGLSVVFDTSGCIEYAEAVTETSDDSGTCDTSVSRTMKIDTLSLCNECIIRCAAATSCQTSAETSVTIDPDITITNSTCTVCHKAGEVGLVCDGETQVEACIVEGDSSIYSINATGSDDCSPDEDAVTSDDFPSWGVALIVVAVIVGLVGISAIFFYSYMQKLQNDSDGKILGTAVLKVKAEDDKLYTMPARSIKKEDKVENGEIIKEIQLTDDKDLDIP